MQYKLPEGQFLWHIVYNAIKTIFDSYGIFLLSNFDGPLEKTLEFFLFLDAITTKNDLYGIFFYFEKDNNFIFFQN